MSDTTTPTPPDLTTEQQARADAIAARVLELTSFVGKTFVRNDGTGRPVKVEKYIGVHVIPARGRAEYLFNVECKGHYNANVSATDFLAAHHVIETPVATEALPH